jgi:HTH-type transcriptional regulator/antitoxin HigA
LVRILDRLIDAVGEDESHPPASLMETLGSLVQSYENRNIPEIEGSSGEILKTLMQEHDLKQSDSPEIASQGVISELLSGKRQFDIHQIKRLSQRFNVSPAVFM